MLYRSLILMVLTGLLGACGHTAMPPLAAYHQVMDPNLNPYLRQQIAQQAAASQILSYHPSMDQQAFEQTGSQQFSAQTAFQDNGFQNQNNFAPGFASPDFSDSPSAALNTPTPTHPQAPAKSTASPRPTAAPALKPSPFAPQQTGPTQGKLRLLSYNVWGLPSLLGTQRTERFERLGATLTSYDVVTLQGAYSGDIEILKRSTDFKYHIRHNNGSLTAMNSGLYTLSKHPVLTHDFQGFERCTGTDCLINRGVLMTRINHPQIGPVDIYTTHYQTGQTQVAERIRAEDNHQALQTLLERHSNNFPVIISGDFGFAPDQREYRELMQRLPLRDLYREQHPQQPGYTLDPANPYVKAEPAQRINYLFYLPKQSWQMQLLDARVTHREPVEGLVLSNQYGVSADVQFTAL